MAYVAGEAFSKSFIIVVAERQNENQEEIVWYAYDSSNILKTKLLQCKNRTHKSTNKELLYVLPVDTGKQERPE